MATYTGSCHCGGVTVEFETPTDPAEIEVRTCQCSFCRAHGSISASDPNGRIRYLENTPGAIRRYQFGYKSCDYILCNNCGVYLGATMPDTETPGYATTNLRTYADRALFTKPPRPTVYDDEGLEARLARRRVRWTPIAE